MRKLLGLFPFVAKYHFIQQSVQEYWLKKRVNTKVNKELNLFSKWTVVSLLSLDISVRYQINVVYYVCVLQNDIGLGVGVVTFRAEKTISRSTLVMQLGISSSRQRSVSKLRSFTFLSFVSSSWLWIPYFRAYSLWILPFFCTENGTPCRIYGTVWCTKIFSHDSFAVSAGRLNCACLVRFLVYTQMLHPQLQEHVVIKLLAREKDS